MPVTLPFTLTNTVPDQEASMATLVFIENSLAADPVIPAPGPLASARFFYTAWQFLTPSSGSTAAFDYVSELTVVARIIAPPSQPPGDPASGAALPAPGRRIVFAGQRWQVVQEQTTRGGQTGMRLVLVPAGSAQGPFVEVSNSLALDPGQTLELDWRFGPARLGVTTGLAQGQTAVMQPGLRLFFKPVVPGDTPWLEQRWTPEQMAENATAYTAPIQAENIKIYFKVRETAEAPPPDAPADPVPPQTDPAPSMAPDLPEEAGPGQVLLTPNRIYLFDPPD